jgi:hypothetical protein
MRIPLAIVLAACPILMFLVANCRMQRDGGAVVAPSSYPLPLPLTPDERQ